LIEEAGDGNGEVGKFIAPIELRNPHLLSGVLATASRHGIATVMLRCWAGERRHV
jgi:hypothetical protein